MAGAHDATDMDVGPDVPGAPWPGGKVPTAAAFRGYNRGARTRSMRGLVAAMMYAIIVLIILFLLGYVLLRWLRLVFAEGHSAAREALHVATGGKTAQTLVRDARQYMQQAACGFDFVVASTQAGRITHNLNQYKQRSAHPALPVGLLFAVAVDVDHARLYLRGVDSGPDGVVGEFETLHPFSAVVGIDQVESPFASDLVPGVESALRIVVVDEDQGRTACLALEPAWHIRASDLVARLRSMIEDHKRPDVTPVIVR